MIFHKSNGYKYFENTITIIGLIYKNDKLSKLKLILETTQYVIYELNDLDLLPMGEFVTKFVLNERSNLTPEIQEELMNFVNSIIDDKLRRAMTVSIRDTD